MTDRLLAQMIKCNIIEKEEEEIYRFGLEGLILKLIHYSTYLLIAALLGEVIPFLVFFAAFLILRKNAGGYHAETKMDCYVSSGLTVLGTIVFMKLFRNWSNVEFICILFVIIANILICMIAPLGNRNRELDEEEQKYFKKKTRVFLLIENIFFIAFIISEKGDRFIIISIAISMAMVCEAILLLLEKIRKEKDETDK